MARPLIATNLFNICKKIKGRILIALRPPTSSAILFFYFAVRNETVSELA
jgi:hypothetical protein